MISIHVTDLEGETHHIQVHTGEPLMEALREYEWGVAALCGGMCSCGTCHVYIDPEWLQRLPEMEFEEEDLLDFLDYAKPNSRLSCQLIMEEAHDGLNLKIAPEE